MDRDRLREESLAHTFLAKNTHSSGAMELRQAGFALSLHRRTSPDMVGEHVLDWFAYFD